MGTSCLGCRVARAATMRHRPAFARTRPRTYWLAGQLCRVQGFRSSRRRDLPEGAGKGLCVRVLAAV